MTSFRLAPLLIIICLALASGRANAQLSLSQGIVSSVSWTIDPRTVALGEATIALPGSGDAFASNPAGIAGRSGIWAEYARRSWFLDNDDMQYRSWSAGFATPVGVFMLGYRRNDMGDLLLTSEASPDGTGSIRWYDHTAGLAWGYTLGGAIQVGAAMKVSREVHTLLWGAAPTGRGSLLLPETTIPVVFDMGILCNTGLLFSGGNSQDNLSIGASVQNFGSPERVSYTQFHPSYIYQGGRVIPGPGYTTTESSIQPLPRMLRIGLAYRYRLSAPEGSERLDPLEVTAVGEYRDILNARLGEPQTYWGVGLEVTAFEIVTGRVGGLANPFDGAYGERNTLKARWGLGLQLPLWRIAPTLPQLTLIGSYAWQPLDSHFPTIRAFSLGVQFEPGS